MCYNYLIIITISIVEFILKIWIIKNTINWYFNMYVYDCHLKPVYNTYKNLK